MQLQLHPPPQALAPKKITTHKKRCILEIGIGNSPLQHLRIRHYNFYYHREEICIRSGEPLGKLNVTIEDRTIPSCNEPTYLDM